MAAPQPNPASSTPPNPLPSSSSVPEIVSCPPHAQSSSADRTEPPHPRPQQRLKSIVVALSLAAGDLQRWSSPSPSAAPQAFPGKGKQVRFKLPASPGSETPHCRHAIAGSLAHKSPLRSALKRRPTVESSSGQFCSGEIYSSTAASCADAERGEEPGQWNTVKKKYWWRNSQGATQRTPLRPTTSHPTSPTRRHGKLPGSLQGKCIRCLASDHFAAQCRDPIKCFACGRSGQKAALCTRTRQPAAARTPAPNLSDTSSFPPLPRVTKVRDGDAAARPFESFVISPSTRGMDRELARLSKDRPHVSLATVKDAFCSEFGVRPEDIKVAKHFLEDFFIEFEHRHHRDAATGRRNLNYGNLTFHMRQWQVST